MKTLLSQFKKLCGVLFTGCVLFACASPQDRIVNTPVSHTIQIKQMQFQPAELVVHPGDTVVFVNYDMVAHDVTEETRKAWASGPMRTGATWKMIPKGDANYYCSIHAVMKGRIVFAK